MDYDVIVAGGGMAGLITASSVAKHSNQNLDILVVDRNLRPDAGKKTINGWICGDAVSKRSVDSLAEHIGIKYGKPELEHPVKGVVAYSPNHESKVTFDGEGYVLNRKLLPKRQVADAEKLGVKFQFGVLLDRIVLNIFATELSLEYIPPAFSRDELPYIVELIIVGFEL